jgi:crotonobetaine/carnitine-CoA ligase
VYDVDFARAESLATRQLLQRNALRGPRDVYVDFGGGVSWTRQRTLDEAVRTANGLRDYGVRQGDRVALMLDNGPDFLRTLWGAAVLGATAVPVNTAFRGAALGHVVKLARARCIVVDPRLRDRFKDLAPTAGRLVDPAEVRGTDLRLPELTTDIVDTDVALLMLTSGTTGASKLSCTTYLQTYLGGSYLVADKGFGPEDTALIDLPMFHLAIGYKLAACLVTGTRLAVRAAPDLERYWEVARDAGANLNVLLGSMVGYLLSRPAGSADRQHAIRLTMVAPAPRTIRDYQRRFGVREVMTGYGSTELPVPLALTDRDDITSGTAGRPRPGFQAKVVDTDGDEVPDGVVGELLVRGETPGMVSPGYFGNDAATASSRAGEWVRIGDLFYRAPDGGYFYVDRAKDALRRRGENISSIEVEAIVAELDGVADVACVPVDMPDGIEQEVKIWVVPRAGADIGPEVVFLHCAANMPYFMVPRFVEMADKLPKTHTQRTQKYQLRQQGNSQHTWDRAEAGYRVSRHGVTRK